MVISRAGGILPDFFMVFCQETAPDYVNRGTSRYRRFFLFMVQFIQHINRETKDMTELQRRLFELQDKKYQAFHSKLIPNIEPAHVIGIRTPVLRNFAKAFAKEDGAEAFLQELPHTYYEENNLHMMLIGGIRDYAQCLYEVKRMLPYVDNWATCDFPVPKCFAKHKEELLPEIRTFLASGETYTIRYGIGLLMRLYLDADFKPEYPAMVAEVTSEEYYVNMMIAWYFATALAKQWETCIPYIEERRLSLWVHRKTIQKAVESYRITDEQKAYLKTFR